MAAAYVRMNISVSADLKSEMDNQGSSVNWSAVASRAFRRQLDRIRKNEEEDEMEDVVKRLRQSREYRSANSDSAHSESYELGRDYAMNRAEVVELEHIRDHRCVPGGWEVGDDQQINLEFSRELYGVPAFGPYELHGRIRFDDFRDRLRGELDLEEFESKMSSSPCRTAFLRGAMAVWKEVKKRVEG